MDTDLPMEARDRLINDIDLRTIQLMQAIDHAGSMSGAARLLGLSQPAVTQHLRRAEDRLGLTLVERTAKGAKLAEAGQIICNIAPQMTQSLRFVADRLDEIRGLSAGRVRVVGYRGLASGVLPRFVKGVRLAHPELAVTYEEAEPLAAVESVVAGSHDVAVVFHYPGEQFDADWFAEDDIHTHTLSEEPILAALAVDHPLASNSVLDLAELEEDEWVLPSGSERGAIAALCRERGFEPNVTLASDNTMARLEIVATTGAVTLASQMSIDRQVPAGVLLRGLRPAVSRQIEWVTSAIHAELPNVRLVMTALEMQMRGGHTPQKASSGTSTA